VNLVVIPPKRSTVLVDKIICIDGRTNLDAGPGYQSYLWSTGATTQVLSGVPVGDYWVILKDNGCSVKQFVSVKKAVDPVISEIEISNNTATVKVTGGKAPYKYAVDSPTNWQDSNVFTGTFKRTAYFLCERCLQLYPDLCRGNGSEFIKCHHAER
jgi:hypothetical protein